MKKKSDRGRRRPPLTYRAAGVDIAAADAFVERVSALVRPTYTPEVVEHTKAFAGLMRLDLAGIKSPVIAATCDGVGTKLLVAKEMGLFEGLGRDLVAMNVNDLLPARAQPLLFLDYIASGKITGAALESVVRGMVAGCLDAGCVLLGGETAEMPGLYAPGHFDLAGFAVGIADRDLLPDATRMREGDVILALAASGIHANGLSLARKALDAARIKLSRDVAELGHSIGEELLIPTRIYVRPVLDLMRAVSVKASAHITGGGILGRARAMVPAHLGIAIDPSSYDRPLIFDILQKAGRISDLEMARTFNLGLGYLAVVSAEDAGLALERFGVVWRKVGKITARSTGVDLGYTRI
jgi:phosphoribosylformylglycinamidine cyclo-ligase